VHVTRLHESADLVVVVNAAREGAKAPLGGIQKAILGQLAALRSAGVRVALLSAAHRCAEVARSMGCDVDYDPRWHHVLAPLIVPSMARRLLELRRLRPAAVIHHSGRPWLWTHLVFNRTANLVVMHREIVRPYRFFHRWLALSPGYAQALDADPDSAGRQIAWAPNCLIEPPGHPSGRPSRNNGNFTLGFAGRIGDGKGVDGLFQAVTELRSEGLSVMLKIAGPMDPWVEEAARRHGITDAVDALGWVEQMASFFYDVDCLVLPSEKESFGLVLIEAMATGLPVVATACNGPSSIIVDGETGHLVPIGDTPALVSAIRRLATAPDKAVSMGLAGYRRVLERYTPAASAERLITGLRALGAEFRRPVSNPSSGEKTGQSTNA
jgi:glycosyltransferase involved in cell wall biosynthesis